VKRTHPECAFFLQVKGLHAGRPLREAIPNSVGVITHAPFAFELCFAAYTARAYRARIKGTCIPFVTMVDVQEVLTPWFQVGTVRTAKVLEQVNAVNALLLNLEARAKKLREYRHALCCSL